MYKLMLLAALMLFSVASSAAQTCALDAKEVKPVLSAETRSEYDLKLAKAFAEFDRTKGSADTRIWLGRRTAYLGNYKDAVRIYGRALSIYPKDARLYRHRGHRLITLRCFDDAIEDLQAAARLIKGKPDEVEPDGLPNAKNIPTSTLQSNIWYHLGLAYYLKGDHKNAAKAYIEGRKVSKNNDMRAATVYWQYMNFRRMGKDEEAANLLKDFDTNIEVIENTDYLKLLKLNKGELRPETLLSTIKGDANTLVAASLGYGIGNYFFYNGEREKAATIFRKVTAGNQWASFGYIAAEAEIK